MTKVCHMTSAHAPEDDRIFHKECVSLAKAGYEVYLVERGESYEKNGVHIIGVGDLPQSRRKRMIEGARRVYEAARALNADIYHFHDPELLPYGLKLERVGKKVIYDSHEDYPSTLKDKPYIPKWIRGIVSWGYAQYEKYCCSHFAGVAACYHWTRERLMRVCPNTDLVFNFPIIYGPLTEPDYSSRKICFAGGISKQYNLDIVLQAMNKVDGVKFLLAGDEDPEIWEELEKMPAWQCVEFQGRLPHRELPKQVYQKSASGIVLLSYIAQCHGHVGNLSNVKLFEVMAQGLPVICTDFQLWKEIIDEYACGICVSPQDVSQVEEAMRRILCDPHTAEMMGRNARRAIEEKYNWTIEERKLLKLYETIVSNK